MPATWITFDVARTLKGSGDRRVSIKQFGNCDANSASAVGRVPDVPRYSSGEEVVVFLRRASGRGFTSPVGFEDGVYRVGSEEGRRVARNGAGSTSTDLDRLLDRVADLVARQASR